MSLIPSAPFMLLSCGLSASSALFRGSHRKPLQITEDTRLNRRCGVLLVCAHLFSFPPWSSVVTGHDERTEEIAAVRSEIGLPQRCHRHAERLPATSSLTMTSVKHMRSKRSCLRALCSHSTSV